ncbi:MAG: metalloregulator ArsR/SmtB family transcription factor [Tissierellia bacterium]|nr:metalloregulator ArsR/SmtB family transcription factor [Tissierellia bacterium]
MSKKEFTEEQENLARIAKALAHPVRIAILQLLATQECCYHGDMSEIIPVAKSTLSQHLKELRDAGLIQGTITLPSIKYCINQENWKLAKAQFGAFFKEIKMNSNSC